MVAAFTSAAAITIASSQVKDILGLEFAAENFLGVMINVFKHIQETRLNDLTLGVVCCVFLIGLKVRRSSILPHQKLAKAFRTVEAEAAKTTSLRHAGRRLCGSYRHPGMH